MADAVRTATVASAERVDAAGKAYTRYAVAVERRETGAATVHRRFRQFHAFEAALRRAHPEQAAMLPDFPRKRLPLRSLAADVVAARRAALARWLGAVVSEATLAPSRLTAAFLSADLDDGASFVAFAGETNASVGVGEASDDDEFV